VVQAIAQLGGALSGWDDKLARMRANGRDALPVAETVGFDVVRVDADGSEISFEAQPRHWNPMGTVHGGILCDVADAAMGIAFAATLAPDQLFTTVELKINFLKPVTTGRLRATGKVIKKGRTLGLVESDIYNDAGELVAKSWSTCIILDRKRP
jgi:uncharacterized protein (TIGR00369 family)